MWVHWLVAGETKTDSSSINHMEKKLVVVPNVYVGSKNIEYATGPWGREGKKLGGRKKILQKKRSEGGIEPL